MKDKRQLKTGQILWLNGTRDWRKQCTPNLVADEGALNHPCVVLDLLLEVPGRVRICTVRASLSIGPQTHGLITSQLTSNIPSTNSLLRTHPERTSGQEAYFLEIVSTARFNSEKVLFGTRTRQILQLERELSFGRTSFVDARDCYQLDVAMLGPYEKVPADHHQLIKVSLARLRDMVDDAQERYIQEGWEKSEQESPQLDITSPESSLPASTKVIPIQNLGEIPYWPLQKRLADSAEPKAKYGTNADRKQKYLVRALAADVTVEKVFILSENNRPKWLRYSRAKMERFDVRLGHVIVPDALPVFLSKDDDEDEGEDNEDEMDEEEEDEWQNWASLHYLRGPGYLVSVHEGLHTIFWLNERVTKLEELRLGAEALWYAIVDEKRCWHKTRLPSPEHLRTSTAERLPKLTIVNGR